MYLLSGLYITATVVIETVCQDPFMALNYLVNRKTHHQIYSAVDWVTFVCFDLVLSCKWEFRFAILAEDVLASGFLYKHLVLYVSMFAAKCKYYFIWLTGKYMVIIGSLLVSNRTNMSHDLSLF